MSASLPSPGRLDGGVVVRGHAGKDDGAGGSEQAGAAAAERFAELGGRRTPFDEDANADLRVDEVQLAHPNGTAVPETPSDGRPTACISKKLVGY